MHKLHGEPVVGLPAPGQLAFFATGVVRFTDFCRTYSQRLKYFLLKLKLVGGIIHAGSRRRVSVRSTCAEEEGLVRCMRLHSAW